MRQIYVIGLNHETSKIETRETFARVFTSFSQYQKRLFLYFRFIRKCPTQHLQSCRNVRTSEF